MTYNIYYITILRHTMLLNIMKKYCSTITFLAKVCNKFNGYYSYPNTYLNLLLSILEIVWILKCNFDL